MSNLSPSPAKEPPMLSPDATAVDLPSLLHSSAALPSPTSATSPADPEKPPTKPTPPSSTRSTLPPLNEKSAWAAGQTADEDGSDRDLEARVPADLVGAEAVDLTEDDVEWTYPEGGRGWWVVAGCTIIAAVTLGWPLAWGVFQAYYKAHLFPDTEDSVLSLLGSVSGMVTMPVAFVVGKFADRYGYRQFIIAGCVTGFVAMLTAAFSTTLWEFFLTQGVLQGTCVGLILPVAMSFPSQWFRRRRGLATGIVIAGSSFGGGVASLMASPLLQHLGVRYTLLFYAFYHLLLMSLACLMLQNRPHPLSACFTHAPIQWWDSALFKDARFWSIALAVFFTVFGYLPPYFYIQLYTQSRLPDLDPALYPVPAAVMNFSAACGRTAIGLLADKVGVVNAFFGAVLLSGCCQLVLWNLAESFPVIIVFSILVGFFGAAFLSMTSVIGGKLFGVRNLATLSGILMMFNMPGNAAGSPLAGAIFSASGGNWHAPICFSGACSVLGACLILYARFKMEPRVFAIY